MTKCQLYFSIFVKNYDIVLLAYLLIIFGAEQTKINNNNRKL